MTGAFIITIDTEMDNEWAPGLPAGDSNLATLPDVHGRLRALGVRPTYLFSYGAIGSPSGKHFAEAVARSSEGEIGAHLHPWETPPFSADEVSGGARHAFPSELEPAVLRAKLAVLTEAIGSAIGRPPLSYRAGRWGIDGRGISLLEELGYQVDSSVSPLIDWRGADSRFGPCFRSVPRFPYFPDPSDVCRPGESTVLEVPVSIRLNRSAGAWHSLYLGLSRRHILLRGLSKCGVLKPIWLRPTYSSSDQMLWLARRMLAEGAPVLNMMFHSSELSIGTSPYVQSECELARTWVRIDRTIECLLGEMALEPLTLSEFGQTWLAQNGGRVTPQTSSARARRRSC